MGHLKPKFISFDCYGTLINFQMASMARDLFQSRVRSGEMEQFVRDFAAYRLDEVLGEWKPYADVIHGAVERTCHRWGIEFIESNARDIYAAVPTWGPHPDVPQALDLIARRIPLVILSNASDDQIGLNVARLGAAFHAVYTAQQAQAYKPRLRAFEYMLDHLGCGPEEILHVSSSLRYDLMSANDIGIRNKVFVSRGHERGIPEYGYREIKDLRELPGLVGL